MKNRIQVQNIFTPEDLLPAVASLSDRYTSRESSSVTYETANMLMEAVLYCIRECLNEEENMMTSETLPEPLLLYEKGYEAVLAGVKSANALYEELIQDFIAYGCRNYSDTVLKGMPAFFLNLHARTLGTTINETVQAQSIEFVCSIIYTYNNGKDRVYFGPVARFLN